MKRKNCAGFLALILVVLLLTGCSRPLPLSERGIVKLIAIAPAEEGFAAHIFFLTANGDGGKEGPSHKPQTVKGTGQTLAEALESAKEKAEKELFFAQSELLLLAQELTREQMDAAVDWFTRENWSRANTAVYGAKEKELPQKPEEWQNLAEGLEKLQLHPQPLIRRIFAFGEGEDWFLPGWEKTETDGIVSRSGTVITPSDGRWLLDGWAYQLSRVFLEKSGSLSCLSGEDLCTLQNITPAYMAEQKGERLYLTVTLIGRVEDYGGQMTAAELERAVKTETENRCGLLYHLLCLQRGCDPFRFGWHLAAQNTPLALARAKAGTLFDSDTLRFVCRVQTD